MSTSQPLMGGVVPPADLGCKQNIPTAKRQVSKKKGEMDELWEGRAALSLYIKRTGLLDGISRHIPQHRRNCHQG